MASAVSVAVRVRPFFEEELESLENDGEAIEVTDTSITVIQKLNAEHEVTRAFNFSHCYSSMCHEEGLNPATNEEIYQDMVSAQVKDVCDGFNVNVLMYGQTGSGKTYTMVGTPDDPGAIPRACQDLFKHMEIRPGIKVTASYVEIYNDQVIDLLDPKVLAERKRGTPSKGGKLEISKLKVREHPELGPFADGKIELPVKSSQEALDVFRKGNAARHVSATDISPESSRSHGRFSLTLTHPKGNLSQLSLVDLGGTGQGDGGAKGGKKADHTLQVEGAAINKSLATLGMVMNALAKASKDKGKAGAKKVHVPYRDSQLTWLLKTALGGNSRTVFLAAVSPCHTHYDESVSTLRYAERASAIMNTATTKLKKSKAVLEAEAEAARIAAEEEAERIRLEEEAARLAEEEAAEEAALAARMEELAAKAAAKKAAKEAEEARQKAEEEARRKAEEEARREAEEEARLKAEEEARLKAEEEARLKAEEEARLKAEEEARLKAEEEARLKAEEEARLKAEEEARLKAEEEARLKAEEEARRKAEEEARRQAEEEARLKAEEEARKAEADRLRFEMEAKMKQEQELARLRAEEAAARAALEEKRQAEEARKAAEAEAERTRQRAAEEAERAAREEARKKAEEDRIRAEEARIAREEARRRKIEEQEAITSAPAREAERLAEAERRAREAAAERKSREAADVELPLGAEPDNAAEREIWRLKKKKAEKERKQVEIEKQSKITTDAEAEAGKFTLSTKLRAVTKDEMRGDQRDPTSAGQQTKKKKKKKEGFVLPISGDGNAGSVKEKKKKKKKKEAFALPTTDGGDNAGSGTANTNPFM